VQSNLTTDGFTSPPKEVVLWIFVAHKNPSFSAGFEHADLESSGKHANHYTTEGDYLVLISISTFFSEQDRRFLQMI
jgi:hypothetical protein